MVRLALLPAALLLPALSAAAVNPPVHWAVLEAPHTVQASGSAFDIKLGATIDPGWHLYALEEPANGPIATEIGLEEGDPAELLGVDPSRPHTASDASFGMATSMYLAHAEFTLHLRTGQVPVHTVHVLVRYQSCNNQVCLPPRTDTIPVTLAAGR